MPIIVQQKIHLKKKNFHQGIWIGPDIATAKKKKRAIRVFRP